MASEKAGACGCGIESQRGQGRDGSIGAGRTPKARACAERRSIGDVGGFSPGEVKGPCCRRRRVAIQGGGEGFSGGRASVVCRLLCLWCGAVRRDAVHVQAPHELSMGVAESRASQSRSKPTYLQTSASRVALLLLGTVGSLAARLPTRALSARGFSLSARHFGNVNTDACRGVVDGGWWMKTEQLLGPWRVKMGWMTVGKCLLMLVL